MKSKRMLHGKRKRMTCKKRGGSSNCKDEIAKAKLFLQQFPVKPKERKQMLKKIQNLEKHCVQIKNNNNNKSSKNISKEEMDNCSSFCENQYFKKYEDQKYHPQGINAELKKGVIDSCKARFCNPRCPYPNRANKSLRYACDTCKKTFPGLQKLGAITNCDYDSLFNR